MKLDINDVEKLQKNQKIMNFFMSKMVVFNNQCLSVFKHFSIFWKYKHKYLYKKRKKTEGCMWVFRQSYKLDIDMWI